MATERPLPLETLLPFARSPQDIRAVLNDVPRRDFNVQSASPESQDDEDASGNDKPKRQKRSRACVACRNMKIRCLPVEGQDDCKACSKVNRQCVMPGPPRKRQKTVHKVAELEKKINLLTDALLAKQRSNSSSGDKTEDSTPKDATTISSEPTRTEASSVNTIDSYGQRFLEAAKTSNPRFVTGCEAVYVNPGAKDNYVDVIERGELSIEMATSMFEHWRDNMADAAPMVLFPKDTLPQEIRSSRPMTFLSILHVASPCIEPAAQPMLTTEINKQLSERTMFHGDKSLDLIHACLLNSQYYTRPRTGRDMTFNILIQAALTMALELGIGKRSKLKRPELEELELCRTWLSCYQAHITVATVLRLPPAIRFGPRVEECLRTVSRSPLSLPGDKWLCAQVELARISEDVAAAFALDDPGADLDFNEPRVQYQLKAFRRQLQLWEKSVGGLLDRRLAEHQAACINLYIHEIAFHTDHNVDDFRPQGFLEEPKLHESFCSPRHIEALTTLLQCSHKALDLYLSLENATIRALNNLYIVWNGYAIVMLIKLHWYFHSPDSKSGSIFKPELKTTYYLDAILAKLNEVAAGGHSPCSEAFGFVFMKLKIWHLRRSGQLPEEEEEDGNTDQQRDQRARVPNILNQDTVTFFGNIKRMDMPTGPEIPTSTFDTQALPAMPPTIQQNPNNSYAPYINNPGFNLNAAYDAASYGNTNWDQFNFSTEELNMFDVYMNNSGYMGYLL